ncbi:MAG: response regulator [Flavobacteriales bacterium]|jgi:two-component system, cell cycle response regulator DivK|nr:response regulator [Flavobacteriales bacterium]
MKRALYVEDDMINRLIMAKYLINDFIVDTASSSTECFLQIERNTYDVILLDINLGHNDIDGITLMKQIRKLNLHRKVIFGAITAYVDTNDKSAILNAGFDLFHPKPIDRTKLILELNTLLKN